MAPVAVPSVLGLKTTPKLTLLPAGKVRGRVRPLSRNAELLSAASEIVSADAPVLMNVCLLVCVPPTGTLPKLRLTGEAASLPAAIAFPESAIVATVRAALFRSTTDPEGAPVPRGVNLTVKLMARCAAIVTGNVGATTANPLPRTIAFETMTVEDVRLRTV
jgi:hypothetical protein